MKVIDLPENPRKKEIDDVIDNLIAEHATNSLDGLLVITLRKDSEGEELNMLGNSLAYTSKLGMLDYAKEEILDAYRNIRYD